MTSYQLMNNLLEEELQCNLSSRKMHLLFNKLKKWKTYLSTIANLTKQYTKKSQNTKFLFTQKLKKCKISLTPLILNLINRSSRLKKCTNKCSINHKKLKPLYNKQFVQFKKLLIEKLMNHHLQSRWRKLYVSLMMVRLTFKELLHKVMVCFLMMVQFVRERASLLLKKIISCKNRRIWNWLCNLPKKYKNWRQKINKTTQLSTKTHQP